MEQNVRIPNTLEKQKKNRQKSKENCPIVKKEAVIYKLKTKMLSKFDFADGEIEANGAIFEIDEGTLRCTSCNLVKF